MIRFFKLQITAILLGILANATKKEWTINITKKQRKLLSLRDDDVSLSFISDEDSFTGYIFFNKDGTPRVLNIQMPTVSIDVENNLILMINGRKYNDYKIADGWLKKKNNHYILFFDHKMADYFGFLNMQYVTFQLSPGKTVYEGFHGYGKYKGVRFVPTFISNGIVQPHESYVRFITFEKETSCFLSCMVLNYRDVQSIKFSSMKIGNYTVKDIGLTSVDESLPKLNLHVDTKSDKWTLLIPKEKRQLLSLGGYDEYITLKVRENNPAGYILFNEDRTPRVLNINMPTVLIDVENNKILMIDDEVFDNYKICREYLIYNKETKLYTLTFNHEMAMYFGFPVEQQVVFRLSPDETVFKGYHGYTKDENGALKPTFINVDWDAQVPEIRVIYIDVEKEMLFDIKCFKLRYRDIDRRLFMFTIPEYNIGKVVAKLKRWTVSIPKENRKELSLGDNDDSITFETDERSFTGYIFFNKDGTPRILNKKMPTVSIDVKKKKVLMIDGVIKYNYENYDVVDDYFIYCQDAKCKLTFHGTIANNFGFPVDQQVVFRLSPGKTVFKGYHGYTKDKEGNLKPTFMNVDGETQTPTYIEVKPMSFRHQRLWLMYRGIPSDMLKIITIQDYYIKDVVYANLKQWNVIMNEKKRNMFFLDNKDDSISFKTYEDRFAGFILFNKDRTPRVLNIQMPTVSIDVKKKKVLMIDGVIMSDYEIPDGLLIYYEKEDLYILSFYCKMATHFGFSIKEKVKFRLSQGETVFKGYHGYTKDENDELKPTFINVDYDAQISEIPVIYVEAIKSHLQYLQLLSYYFRRNSFSLRGHVMFERDYNIVDVVYAKLKQWNVIINKKDRKLFFLDDNDDSISFKTYEDRFAGYILFNKDRTPRVLNLKIPTVSIDVKNKKVLMIDGVTFNDYKIPDGLLIYIAKANLYKLTFDVKMALDFGFFVFFKHFVVFRLSPGETVYKGYHGYRKDENGELKPTFISVNGKVKTPEIIHVIYIEVKEPLPTSPVVNQRKLQTGIAVKRQRQASGVKLEYRDFQSKELKFMTIEDYNIEDVVMEKQEIRRALIYSYNELDDYRIAYSSCMAIKISKLCRKQLEINAQDLVFMPSYRDFKYFSGFLFFDKRSNYILRSVLFPTIFISVKESMIKLVLSVEKDEYKLPDYIMPDASFKNITKQQLYVETYKLTFDHEMAEYFGFEVGESAIIKVKKDEDMYKAYHGYKKTSEGKLEPVFITTDDNKSELEIKANEYGKTQLIYKNKSCDNGFKVRNREEMFLEKKMKKEKKQKKGEKKKKLMMKREQEELLFKPKSLPLNQKGKKKPLNISKTKRR